MKKEPNDDIPKDSSKGLNWVQSRMVRVSQGGSQGAQASVIGFALAGPIVGGFLIGYFIDQYFGTQYWVIIIGLLGVYGGFREMFSLLKNMQPDIKKRTPPPGREKIVPKAPPIKTEDAPPSPPQRLFKVPPPPFMESGAKEKSEWRQPQNAEEVLRELLGEEDEDEDDKR